MGRREAQLLIDFAGSPIVAPGAGRRAPDVTGLTRDAVAGELRLFELLSRRDHTTLLYVGNGTTGGHIDVYLIAAPGVDMEVGGGAMMLPVIDTAGEFARTYGATEAATFVVRPDGYLGFASSEPASSGVDAVTGYLRNTFG